VEIIKTKKMKTILERKVQISDDVTDTMYTSDIMSYYKIDTDTQFIKDFDNWITKGGGINRATYNLMISKRDIGLFCLGMKPNAQWRLKDLKAYFGVKGSKEKCKEQIELLTELFIPQKHDSDWDEFKCEMCEATMTKEDHHFCDICDDCRDGE